MQSVLDPRVWGQCHPHCSCWWRPSFIAYYLTITGLWKYHQSLCMCVRTEGGAWLSAKLRVMMDLHSHNQLTILLIWVEQRWVVIMFFVESLYFHLFSSFQIKQSEQWICNFFWFKVFLGVFLPSILHFDMHHWKIDVTPVFFSHSHFSFPNIGTQCRNPLQHFQKQLIYKSRRCRKWVSKGVRPSCSLYRSNYVKTEDSFLN